MLKHPVIILYPWYWQFDMKSHRHPHRLYRYKSVLFSYLFTYLPVGHFAWWFFGCCLSKWQLQNIYIVYRMNSITFELSNINRMKTFRFKTCKFYTISSTIISTHRKSESERKSKAIFTVATLDVYFMHSNGVWVEGVFVDCDLYAWFYDASHKSVDNISTKCISWTC